MIAETRMADLPAGQPGDNLERACALIDTHSIAGEKPVYIDTDRVFISDRTHHSNHLIVDIIAGMCGIDMSARRVADAVQRVAGHDTPQKVVIAALGGVAGNTQTRERIARASDGREIRYDEIQFSIDATLFDCVQSVIRAESLDAYFEIDDAARGNDPKYWHHAIRPRGDISGAKARAQQEKMPTMRRTALLALLSLYNAPATREQITGRGWTMSGSAIGAYIADRLATNPEAAASLVSGFVVYPGW